MMATGIASTLPALCTCLTIHYAMTAPALRQSLLTSPLKAPSPHACPRGAQVPGCGGRAVLPRRQLVPCQGHWLRSDVARADAGDRSVHCKRVETLGSCLRTCHVSP